jgi:uncharacterized protein YijF (DUF1287 family)
VQTLLLLAVACGLPDRGIYPDLAPLVSAAVPSGLERAELWLRVDPAHSVVTLYARRDAVKAYPAAVAPSLRGGDVGGLGLVAGDPSRPAAAGLVMRAADLDELRALVGERSAVTVARTTRLEDHDDDGIVDALDILVGAKKLLYNHAHYLDRYVSLPYPGGDVPRSEGVCSDTVVRALRNAGIDLQKEIHEDILQSPRAYPMVEKVDPSINHRRVRTLLPWFERHFTPLSRGERFLPGDVVFFDTLPSRDGPDHLGVVSDRAGASGLPMIINNWSEGTVDAEMDLLAWVPVTHHFRAKTILNRP